jgi:hypothetical protein
MTPACLIYQGCSVREEDHLIRAFTHAEACSDTVAVGLLDGYAADFDALFSTALDTVFKL